MMNNVYGPSKLW